MSIDLAITTPAPADATEAEAEAKAAAARAARNRRNAQNSTGPKTEAGKQRSRWNAVRHGASGLLLHRREDQLAANLLEKELCQDYQPEGALERQTIERMAFHSTRLRSLEAQISTLEHLVVDDLLAREPDLPQDLEMASLLAAARHDNPDALRPIDLLSRYHRDHERDYRRTVELFVKLRKERRLAERDFRQAEREELKKQEDRHFANSAREQLKQVPALQNLSPTGLMEWQKYEQERLAKQNEATEPKPNQQQPETEA